MTERKTACNILMRVEGGGFANLLMLSLPDNLDARQVSFVTALVYGTLERKITLDFVLSSLIKGGLKKLDVEVLTILRMSAYQLLYMDGVPDYAVINEGVKLCRGYRKASAAGMVNAVLRRVKSVEISEDLHIKYSIHPDIIKGWKTDYPERYAEIAKNSLGRADCCIYTNIKKTTTAELAKLLAVEGVETSAGFADNTLICKGEPPIRTDAFEKGLFHVIGTSSALAAQTLLSRKPKKVLDLCAAPGGKTAVLAMSAEQVVAGELHPNRLSTIEKLAKRLGLDNITVLCNDATKSVPEGEFDAVLCDVPCSGTGVLSKRPEIRTTSPDSEELCVIQGQILDSAVSALKVGGVLCYSTCALSRAENERQIEALLNRTPSLKALSLPFKVPKNSETGDGYVTFFPDDKTFDGFFVAFLEKVW